MGGVFVGRQVELELLQESLSRARDGSPSVVLLEAAAGDGKSALLERFVSTAIGVSLAKASGDDTETSIAYGVYRQLLAGLSSGGWVATELNHGASHGDLQVVGDHLLQLLTCATPSDGATLLLIDDAHLADRSSLAAVTYALRRLQADRILAVIACRPEAIGRLPTGLLKLVEKTDSRIGLGGLSVTDVRALARAFGQPDVGERAARRLHHYTGGSPLYLRALFQNSRVGRREWLTAPLPTPVPFARLISAQLNGVSAGARQLAQAAAVLGLRCDLRAAATIAGITDPLPLAEELQTIGLTALERSLHLSELAFSHSLIQAAVAADIPPTTLASLHLAAAVLSSGAEALFHRAAATAGTDPDLATELVALARHDITRGSWRTAADALFEASRIMPLGLAQQDTLLQAVEALLVAGDVPLASTYLGQIAAMSPTARQLQVQALMAWMTGKFATAEAFAAQAWSFVTDLEPQERDRLAGLLAQMCIMQGKNLAAINWSRKALHSGLLDRRRQASTLATLVGAMSLEGLGGEAFALLPTEGDLNDAGYRELVGMRGLLLYLRDDPVSGATNLRIRLRPNLDDHLRGQSPIEVLTATGPDGIEPNKMIILAVLAQAEYRSGNWDISAAVADQAIALIEDTEQYWIAPWVYAAATLVPAGRGEWDQAEHHLAYAQQMVDRFGGELNRGHADDAAVHLAACRGDNERVIASAEWLLTHGKPYQQQPGLHTWPVHYADALVKLGRYEDAEGALDRWEASAQEHGSRSRMAALARVRGDLNLRRRNLAAARHAYETALIIGNGPFDALERAVFYTNRGRFLRRRGERRAAIFDLQEARRRLDILRAAPFLEDVRAELGACGVYTDAGLGPNSQAHEAAGAWLAALTPQEKAVAQLVVAGQSNREIAEALVLSAKTVTYHLGHVYAKLELKSRSQLIALSSQLARGSRLASVHARTD